MRRRNTQSDTGCLQVHLYNALVSKHVLHRLRTVQRLHAHSHTQVWQLLQQLPQQLLQFLLQGQRPRPVRRLQDGREASAQKNYGARHRFGHRRPLAHRHRHRHYRRHQHLQIVCVRRQCEWRRLYISLHAHQRHHKLYHKCSDRHHNRELVIVQHPDLVVAQMK